MIHEHRRARHDGPGAESVSTRSNRSLLRVLGLTTTYLVAEVAGGLLTGSLALLADAGHMFMDMLGLLLALLALRVARRPATLSKTYGFYRAEVLAAAVNALALFAIGGSILYEAWGRFYEPRAIDGVPMLAIATGGLVVNLIGAWALHADAEHSLNVRGAFFEVVADALGSVGAIVAGVVIALTGWTPIDALVSAFIGLLILPRTWILLRNALDVLLEATPAHIDVDAVTDAMRAVPGVSSVHDLHVWTITSGFVAMSGHVQARGRASGDVLHDLQGVLRERFGVEHVTLQVESDDHVDDGACCVADPRCLAAGSGPRSRMVTSAGRR